MEKLRGEGHVFTMMVDNEFGVLTRITALIRRMGWNIRSLAVAETATPEVSRLTVCMECRGQTIASVVERLRRLDCVRTIALCSPETHVVQELMLVRLDRGDADALIALGAGLSPQAVDEDEACVMVSLCGPPEALDRVLVGAKALGTHHIARTGALSLRKCGADAQEAGDE